MKKLIAILMAAIMLLSLLAACGKKDNDSDMLPETPAETPEETPEETPDEPAEDPTLNDPAATPEEDPTMDQPATMPLPGEEPDSEMAVTPEETPEAPVYDEELLNLLNSIYEIKAPEFPTTHELPFDISDPDSVKYYTGLDDASLISSAIVSEAAMGSQAYSLVLARAADASKVAEIAEAMKNGIDTRKWVCVEADDLRVVAAGDIIMLVMIDSEYAASITSNDMVEAFKQATGLDLDVE